MEQTVAVTETGALGIYHLKRYWHRRMALLENRGRQTEEGPDEENLDYILLHGLGLGIVEPDDFLLHHRPDFEQFEQWVAQTLGGAPEPAVVERVNGAITALLECPRNTYPMAAKVADPVFSPEDMAFWEANGYVILRDAVAGEDARAAELAVWKFLGKDPQRPETWYDGRYGFWTPLFHHPALDRNRRSKRIHKAFAQLWGTEDLIATFDRASLNLPMKDGVIDYSGPSKLHWDASIAQPMPFGVLGILYLNDTAAEQGAFQCVPGFHHRLGQWLEELPPGEDPRAAAQGLKAVPIAANAGDLIIWRQALPHGSSRNHGSYPRVAQYIAMYPPDFANNPVWK